MPRLHHAYPFTTKSGGQLGGHHTRAFNVVEKVASKVESTFRCLCVICVLHVRGVSGLGCGVPLHTLKHVDVRME